MEEQFREIEEESSQEPTLPQEAQIEVPETPAEEAKVGERRADRRMPAGLGMTAIVAIVAIVVIASAFIVIERAQGHTRAARNRLMRGEAALVDGDMYLALYEFSMALVLDPRLPGAHSALGGIAVANGQADIAVTHFGEELNINPGDRKSHLALGCIYALACVPPDDPNELRPYLLSRFGEVIPLDWPEDLEFVPEEGVYALREAVYHFEYAAERLPDDPAPAIGLALTCVANYDLGSARDKLSALMAATDDEETVVAALGILQDINNEELYRRLLAQAPQVPAAETMPESAFSTSMPDLSSQLGPLPPMPGFAGADYGVLSAGGGEAGGFGSRGVGSFDISGRPIAEPEFTTTITRENLEPRPTVKPVSDDISLPETGEIVRTVKIANIHQEGMVGFREGETIVMPNTNVEVKVVEASDERIVLEERACRFVWVRGEVGWTLDSAEYLGTEGGDELSISAYQPGEEGADEETAQTDETVETDESDGEVSPEEELGPDVGGE